MAIYELEGTDILGLVILKNLPLGGRDIQVGGPGKPLIRIRPMGPQTSPDSSQFPRESAAALTITVNTTERHFETGNRGKLLMGVKVDGENPIFRFRSLKVIRIESNMS